MLVNSAAARTVPQGDLLRRLHTQAAAGTRLQQKVPVHPVLAGLLDGGLQPGAAYSITGGSLLLALLAEPSKAGAWCGVVGVPELGTEAARSAGVALDRLVLVPKPGERWLSVVAALAEALPVVAVRPPGRVPDVDANRLAARLRERSCVLLVCGEWPRTQMTLTLTERHWSGLGSGHGYLSSREVVISAVDKRQAMPRIARMILPDSHGRPAEAPEQDSDQFRPRPRLRAVS